MKCKTAAILLSIGVCVAGCATDARLKSDCDWARPIWPSAQDALTRPTKEQILAHNEAGAKLCGWTP